ncbi:MAG TPA: hypothetical protein VIL05_05055 [Thermoclostridium sp.]
MKKQSIGFLIAIIVIICIYLLISNIAFVKYLSDPMEAAKRSLKYFKEADALNINSKIVFNLNNDYAEQVVLLNAVIHKGNRNEWFEATLADSAGIMPGIKIEYTGGTLNLEIPGIASESINIGEGINQPESDNTAFDEGFIALIEKLADEGKIHASITSSDVLIDKPDKRDRKEWVIMIQLDMSMYDLLSKAPDLSIAGEALNESLIPLNSAFDIDRMKNTNIQVTLISTTDMQPRLFEMAILDESGENVMLFSGEITY